nr:hypothetical protein [Anaerolineaceae bacterium]
AIPIDQHGKNLRRSMQQNDARASQQIEELKQRLEDYPVLQKTGAPITQQSIAPKLMWLMQNEPALWESTTKIVGSYDLMAYWLTGEFSIESNWAVESGLLDWESGTWNQDILNAAGISAELLPDPRQPHEIIGWVTEEASKSTGLQTGTPVVAGTADHVASAFATGLIDEGDLTVKLGGAGDILMVTNKPVIDPRLYFDYHLIPNKYLPNGCMAASGSLIRWFQAQIGCQTSLKTLDKEAEKAGPGAGGIVMLPYFLGEKTPINDPAARGAFIGLHLGHERGHLFRAVLEGISFGFRHHLEIMNSLGFYPQKVRVTNGGANSKLWTQVTADILNLTLEKVKVSGGSALGVAFVAGMGMQAFDSWHSIEQYIEIERIIKPRPDKQYETNFETYKNLYPALKYLAKESM